MRSVAVLDQCTPSNSMSEVEDLLVLWQHPVTREIVPIGRFAREGERFTFAYTRAAAEVAGFRPLPGLASLQQRYESSQIPAVFNQRVMSPDRPDYGDYLETLGLTSAQATPWEQIVESGGDRAGDTLQFMQVPAVIDGRAQARFLANGLRHIPESERQLADRVVHASQEEQEGALQSLRPGDLLLLEPELDNDEDPDAILLTTSGVPVGWVPKALSSSLRPIAEARPCHASVHRIGGPGSPFHLRLVLDLDLQVPEDFRFDREGRWEPLAR